MDQQQTRGNDYERTQLAHLRLERERWEREIAQAVIGEVGAILPTLPALGPILSEMILLGALGRSHAITSALSRAHRWAVADAALRHEVKILIENPHGG